MNNFKKVELHLHLDGSLRLETVFDLAQKKGLIKNCTIESIKDDITITKNDKTLVDYLRKFDLPGKILQTSEALKRVAFEIVEDLAKENTIYAEIRIAPMLHINGGLSHSEVVESVLYGFELAMKKYPIKVNLLLCAMRHFPPEESFYITDLAIKFKNRGVVGLDLAGDEENYSVKLFSDLFLKAKKLNIPFTIHAGEARGSDSIIDSIELGASRLGHGIRAYEDTKVMELIKEKDICLECCPISNFHTNAIPDFSKYPLKYYLENDISATLNTDNRTVSDTNYNKEIEFLKDYIDLTTKDIEMLNLNAINHAFISQKEKDILIKVLGDN